MVAECRTISHGAAMTIYATKNNRADIVFTQNLDDTLPPVGMWGAMKTIQQRYEPKFRRKPVTCPIFCIEASPSKAESDSWQLEDWGNYARTLLDRLEVAAQPKNKRGKNGKLLQGLDLSRSQIFACLHHDAKSGIPHLHILINRIDLDGNLLNDSFIGKKLMKAVHSINVENGWELPEDIQKAHIAEISKACYSILSDMQEFSWEEYGNRLNALGYKLKLKESKGEVHGYSIWRGNSKYKASLLGHGRDLMASKIEETWNRMHPMEKTNIDQNREDVSKRDVSRSKPSPLERALNTLPSEKNQPISSPNTFSETFNIDGKETEISIPMSMYNTIKGYVEVPRKGQTTELDVINVAILLAANYINAATAMSESCGGGGSPGTGWGRDKDDDDDKWARKCVAMASRLCKPVIKYKRSR